jgi:NADPH:quinone reductase-like Zn-dependent oxidoreductase
MKAVRIHQFGASDVVVIDDVAVPTPGPGDIIVRVIASAVNPIEFKIRRGDMGKALGRPLPVTLGWDCAGVVAAVGPGATRFKVGDPVFAFPEFTRDGTHAEFIALPAAQAAFKPTSLTFEQAVAMPMTAQAAWTTLRTANLRPGERVLVQGAAGAVGHWLVQLVKRAGAHVIATAGAGDLARVRMLGADQVIDYGRSRFEDEAGTVDAVLDLVGGETQTRSWNVIGEAGRLVSTVPPAGPITGRKPLFVFTRPDGDLLGRIGMMIDGGELKPFPVTAVLPLEDIRRVHEQADSGRLVGKTILAVSEA